MPNAILTAGSIVDRNADKMQVYFGGSIGSTTSYQSGTLDNAMLKTDPSWFATEVDQTMGSIPGTAVVIMPCTAGVRDEAAFSVVFNPDGPLADIQQGTAGCVRKRYIDASGAPQEQLLFVGQVTKIQQIVDSGEQALKVTLHDARHQLKDVRIVGRYIYQQGTFYYQHGWPSHFNPGGRPNCVFSADGTPAFSPYPDFGLAENQEPPDPASKTPGIACYWTPSNMLLYILSFWGPQLPDSTAAVVAAAQAQWPELQTMPGWVVWPTSFGADLDKFALQNFNAGANQNNTSLGGGRKGRDIPAIYGASILGDPYFGDPGVLDVIFEAAGGYSWTLQYSENIGSSTTIVAVRNRYVAVSDGIDMPYAQGKASSVKSPTITGGSLTESSLPTVTRAVGIGSLAKIETKLSTVGVNWAGSAGLGSYTVGNASLIPAWTPSHFAAWSALACSLGGGTPTAQTFAEASSKYWWVLTTWMLNPAYDFQAHTMYANYPRAPIQRPLWPTLLSFQGSPTGAGDILPYPIRMEIIDGGQNLGPEFDGLEVWDDGILYAPKLRDIKLDGDGTTPGAFKWNNGLFNTAAGALDITIVDILATLAIPCDHRLSYAVGIGSDVKGTDASKFTTIEDSPDSDKFAPNFSRTIVLDLNGVYDLWLRYNSFPTPQSAGGTGAANATTLTNAVRSDYPLLQAHMNRTLAEKARLDRTETPLEFDDLVTNYALGTTVNNVTPIGDKTQKNKPYKTKAIVSRRRFLSERTVGADGRSMVYKNKTQHFLR